MDTSKDLIKDGCYVFDMSAHFEKSFTPHANRGYAQNIRLDIDKPTSVNFILNPHPRHRQDTDA